MQILFLQFRDGFDDKDYLMNPAVASFLAGSQAEHYGQMLLVWFLPILLLGLCADRAIRDHKEGYDVVQIMRVGRKKYFHINLTVNAILAAAATGIGLLVNYLLALAFFHGGKDFLSDDLEYPNLMGAELKWQYQHTVLIVLIMIVLTVLIAVIVALMSYVLSSMFLNYYAVYTVAFVIWFAQIISKYSVTYLMQPFSEYGLKYQFPSAGIFIAVAAVLIGYEYWSVSRRVEWL